MEKFSSEVLLVDPVRKAVSRAAAPLSVIGAVGGFIIDIIAPLGNYAPWVALLSLAGALVSLGWFVIERRKRGHDAWDTIAAGVMVIFAASTVIFGVWSIIFAVGPQRGYLATNIPPVADFQAQLLGLQHDVTEIKNTTRVTATQVAVVATTQAQGFADIQAAFAQLQTGTVIANPQTPQEWYSNARLYQLRGDTANAIKSYEGYFKFNLDYVDPYLEYTDLLKATAGIAQTSQKLNDLFNARRDSVTLDLVSARLLDSPTDRLARFTALAARAPQYGPVFLELGQEYDRALAVSLTADLLKKEGDSYATLFKLEETQGFSRYYIDKALAESYLADAKKARDGYAKAGQVMGTVDIQIYNYAAGVQFVVAVTEVNPRQLLFSIDDPQPKRDAGKNSAGFLNPIIGPIALPLGDHTFYAQYTDANGVPSQVFIKKFRVDPIAVSFTQQPPDFSTNTIPGIFILGVVGATGVEPYTYMYSIDSKALDKTLSGISTATLQVTGLVPGNHILYIRGQAADGKATDVVEYPFTVK
jgi:hypothetical protein